MVAAAGHIEGPRQRGTSGPDARTADSRGSRRQRVGSGNLLAPPHPARVGYPSTHAASPTAWNLNVINVVGPATASAEVPGESLPKCVSALEGRDAQSQQGWFDRQRNTWIRTEAPRTLPYGSASVTARVCGTDLGLAALDNPDGCTVPPARQPLDWAGRPGGRQGSGRLVSTGRRSSS
jgi:hypothetical protein